MRAERRAGRRHGRRDGDEQPGLPHGHARGRGPTSSRPTSATAMCSRRCAPGGFTLGGEQSGHVILSDHATTGDGMLAALHVAARMAATGRSLADLAGGDAPAAAGAGQRPRRRQGAGRDSDPVLSRRAARPRPSWATPGRVLLRPSGTEPLVRVMVEAESEATRRVVPNGSPTSSRPLWPCNPPPRSHVLRPRSPFEFARLAGTD